MVALGDTVDAKGFGHGVVRFVGMHHDKDEKRVGVELNDTHDAAKLLGKFGGHKYFDCSKPGKRYVIEV